MNQDEMDAEVLECARYGEEDDLRGMIVAGGRVNHCDAGGNSALHKASANGEVGCLRILKEFGAEYSANDEGNLPSHWAAQNGKDEALKFLIDAYGDKIDMLAQNKFGRSTLTEAFQSQNETVIELCLAHPSASEDRLMPKSGPGASPSSLEQGIQDMEIAEGVSSADHELSSEAAMELHAVEHTMALVHGNTGTLRCRELPITRADNPFGSESAPEDDTTGLGLWPAAVLSARWVAGELQASLAGKVVVELGCGCGLPGLAAARYCNPQRVYLTDIHSPTLLNAAFNARLNAPADQGLDGSAATQGVHNSVFDFGSAAAVESTVASVSGSSVPVAVSRVSWTDPSTFPPAADVLLGSDLVYDTTILEALTKAVVGMLAPDGTFYYVAPDEGRDGMDGLVTALAAKGVVCVDSRPCSDALFANPLVEREEADGRVSAADAYVLHFYDLAAKKPHSCYTFRRKRDA